MAKRAKKIESPKNFNGWTNYETWAVNVWLQNEEGSYLYWREAAGQARAAHGLLKGKNPPRRIQDAKCSLAGRLKDELERQAPDLGGTLWADLLSAALEEVNWFELAGSLLEV